MSPLSVDITGEWSPRQARAVHQALAEEIQKLGLVLLMVDVTTIGGPQRVMFDLTPDQRKARSKP